MANNYSKWNPKDYLNQYYLTKHIAEDERAIYDFIRQFLSKNNHYFKEMLEFGTGPTIHHLIPFTPYVNKIFVSDYLENNLQEIKNWIDGKSSAHNWSVYLREYLSTENKNTNKDLNNLSTSIKKKIVRLVRSDIFQKLPLGEEKTFPLVTSFFCTDCVTDSKKQWHEIIKNLFSLVSLGGWVIMSVLRNTNQYKVGKDYFPSANLNEADIKKALIAGGFAKYSINVEVCKVGKWSAEGFSSIIICSAMKKDHG